MDQNIKVTISKTNDLLKVQFVFILKSFSFELASPLVQLQYNTLWQRVHIERMCGGKYRGIKDKIQNIRKVQQKWQQKKLDLKCSIQKP